MSKKIVVMGGGTGTFPVVAAVKSMTDHTIDLSTIIAVSDSGGSTGRIRDEFGFQPVGDLRQALAALAESQGEQWIRNILLYRFEKGVGLKGHNLGNLILTALQDMTGSTTDALEIAEKVFRLKGKVIPVTTEMVDLQIEYADGTVVVGEHTLDMGVVESKKITQVKLVPDAVVNPVAAEEIMQADVIVIGPGDYYASIMATLVPQGVREAFASSHAKIVYAVNLMTRFTQTHGMTASAHVKGIEKNIGRPVDIILLNDEKVPPELVAAYGKENEFPVIDDLARDPRVVRADLLSTEIFHQSGVDTAHRSLLRHDKHKLSKVLEKVLNG